MTVEVWPGKVRLLFVEDNDEQYKAVRERLALEPQIDSVGTSPTIAEALARASQSQPLLLVCDLHVAGRSVTELITGVAAARVRARILVLTSDASEAEMRKVIAAGASGYVLIADGYAELLQGLKSVGAGRRFFSDAVESQILAQYVDRVTTRFAETAAPITPREREVLTRIGQGQTNKAIAKALQLSVKTVEKHRSNLMRKLGLHNTAAVTVYAIRQGLVNQDALGTRR